MFQLFRYSDKKENSFYISVYLCHIAIWSIAPLISSEIIMRVEQRDVKNFFFFLGIDFILFILTQLVNYFEDISSGRAMLATKKTVFFLLDQKLKNMDPKRAKLKEATLNQFLGESFETASPFFFEYPIKIILNILQILVIVAISYSISPYMICIFLFIIPFCVFLSIRYGEPLSNYSQLVLENGKDIKDYFIDDLHLNSVERFSTQKQLPPFINIFDSFAVNTNKKIHYESKVLNFMMYAPLNAVITLSFALSTFLVIKGKMKIGDVFAINLFVSRFWTPVESLFQIRSDLLAAKASINQINEILNLPTMSISEEKIESLDLMDMQALDTNNKPLHTPLHASLRRGNIYLLMGENGVGKTTLMECILNLCSRYHGTIRINGKDLSENPEHFFQDMCYVPATAYISTFGKLNKFSYGSMGQKKKAQLTFLLQEKKSLYLIDEPTNYLDEASQCEVRAWLKSLRSNNKIILIATHDRAFLKEDYQVLALKKQ